MGTVNEPDSNKTSDQDSGLMAQPVIFTIELDEINVDKPLRCLISFNEDRNFDSLSKEEVSFFKVRMAFMPACVRRLFVTLALQVASEKQQTLTDDDALTSEIQQTLSADDDSSIGSLIQSTTTISIKDSLADKLAAVRELLASMEMANLRKALDRAAEKKLEIASIVADKTLRAKEFSQVCELVQSELSTRTTSLIVPIFAGVIQQGARARQRNRK